jgi:hypothetical protein
MRWRAVGGTAPRALNARDPALNINPRTCKPIFPTNRNRREKTGPELRRGLVNPDSNTDRNPDRSSTDDATGASGATDIRPGAGSIGSAGSLRDSNKVSGQPGLCKRGSLHPLWIQLVPKQPVRVLPIPIRKIFSYQLFDGQTPLRLLLALLPCWNQAAP